MKSGFNAEKMIYRNLGNTGLKVSVLSIGNMINFKPENAQTDLNMFKKCFENGINYIDTAQLYAEGKCQIALGKFIKESGIERENIIISTKIWIAPDPDMNSYQNTNKKHIKQSVKQSLNRMQLDYVDIVFAHAFDQITSIEQVCRSFHQIIQEGQAFYWGTSNWNAEHVFQAFAICEKLNLHKPIAAQNQYHMFCRDQMQRQYRTLFEKYHYGTTIWSPLAGGFLTGKYLDGIPETVSRIGQKIGTSEEEIYKKFFYYPYANQKSINSLRQLKVLAESLGYKLHHLALAWAIRYKHISTAIIGARNPEQVQDNLKALELLPKLTLQLQEKINKILDNDPPAMMQYTKWKPMLAARSHQI